MLSSAKPRIERITIRLPGKAPKQLDLVEGKLVDMPRIRRNSPEKSNVGISRPPTSSLVAAGPPHGTEGFSGGQNPRPPASTLFTDDQPHGTDNISEGESPNSTCHVFFLQSLPGNPTPTDPKSKDAMGDVPRPPASTLFTENHPHGIDNLSEDGRPNLAGSGFPTHPVGGEQPSKKSKKKKKKKGAKLSLDNDSDPGKPNPESVISYSIQTGAATPVSVKLSQRFLSGAPSPPPKLVVERGFISRATYLPCPVECRPVSRGPQLDDPLLPIIFPLLYYNTGRTFASYDRDFLPWANPANIRICTPKLIPEEALDFGPKEPSRWAKARSGKRHGRR